MEIREAILNRRSIRRFQDKPVPQDALLELADLARYYVSGGNMQPMRCAIVSQKEGRDVVFSCLKWAMYLPGFEIRPEQEPQAYLLLIADTSVRSGCDFDCGAAATTVMLAAMEHGLDSCCLGIPDGKKLQAFLGLEAHMKPSVAIALGYAGQKSEAVPYVETIKYAQTAEGNMQVPKYGLDKTLVYSDVTEKA